MKDRISTATKAKKGAELRNKGVDSMSEKELRAEARQLRDRASKLPRLGQENRAMIGGLAELLGVSKQHKEKSLARKQAGALKHQIGARQPNQQQPPPATTPSATENPSTVTQQPQQQVHPQRQPYQYGPQVTPQAKRQRIGTTQQQHQHQHQQFAVSYGNWRVSNLTLSGHPALV